MGAPSAFTFYRDFKKYLGDGTIDLDTDTFKVALLTSSYTPDVSNDDILGDISGSEVANGNGYTTGGVALSGVTWTRSGATVTFDAADPQWTATGSSFAARYAAVYANVTRNSHANPLVGYVLIDSAPADVTFPVGQPVNIVWNAAGIFTLT